MTATLRIKKGRPNYFVVIRYKDETGKKCEKWETSDIPVKGNNKRKAEKWKDDVLAQAVRESVDLNKSNLFADYMEQWLENLRHSIEGSTYEGYKAVFAKHIKPFFEPKKLRVKDITPSHIQQYINNALKSVSSNTVHRHLANISKCLNTAMRQNIGEANAREKKNRLPALHGKPAIPTNLDTALHPLIREHTHISFL